jgi:hypothetical protein
MLGSVSVNMEGAAMAAPQTPGQMGDPPAASAGTPTPSTDTPSGATTGQSGATTTPGPSPSPGSATPSQAASPEPSTSTPASGQPEPVQHMVPEHPPHSAHAHPPSGQGRRGFVVAAAFGVRPNFTPQQNAGAVTTDMATSLQGGLALGFKTGRVVFTVGLDIGAIDTRDSSTYRTTTTFLIVPGLQVALLRSRDHRVELVGSLRLGAGSTMTTDGSSTAKPPALVMYEIAPAVRYWAHKQFAVQFLAGYGGEYQVITNFGGTTSNGRHSLAASIGTMGLF